MLKLVTVTNKDIIADLSKEEDITLLYPLKSFCVGYDIEFEIDEINDFVLVNRILNNTEMDKLEVILKASHIKGIVFDDLGVLEIIKGLDIVKILYLSHIGNNSVSINYYLDYVDSVIVSSDITKEEILFILKNSLKKLVLPVFGLMPLMYSRRSLLKNYNENYNENLSSNIEVKVESKDKYFRIYENTFGTVFYGKNYYNALELLNSDNVLYYWYNPVFLDKDSICNVVLKSDVTNVPSDAGFLYNKTTYKLKGDV